MYLIYDLSGHRPVSNWKAPFTDTFSWPRILHISWILLDEEFKPLLDFNAYAKHSDFTVTEQMTEQAHIDHGEYEENASDVKAVMEAFDAVIKKTTYTFSFNQQYNENIAAAEFLRTGVRHELFKKENFCLMRESTFYCGLPGKAGKLKWPTLNELHAILFGQKYTPAGNARADVVAAARCFIKLMKLGEFEDLFE
jgi:hypothetical protein